MNRILLGAITIALVALGCQKQELYVPDHMSLRTEIRDDRKDSMTGVWRCTKQWSNDIKILWSGWDENFNPLGTYYVEIASGDTLLRWDFTFDSLGNMTSNGHLNFTYYPETNKIHTISNGREFTWNETLDTVHMYIDGSLILWYEVDSVDNILSASNTFNTYEYSALLHPNIHIHYAPTSFFEGPATTFNILDKVYNHAGVVINESIIDSVVDDRVYRLYIAGHGWYNYEWTFLTHNAR